MQATLVCAFWLDRQCALHPSVPTTLFFSDAAYGGPGATSIEACTRRWASWRRDCKDAEVKMHFSDARGTERAVIRGSLFSVPSGGERVLLGPSPLRQIHIPKTGGRVIQASGFPDGSMPALGTPTGYVGTPHTSLTCSPWHVPPGDSEPSATPSRAPGATFCVVRDVVERLLSEWRFRMESDSFCCCEWYVPNWCALVYPRLSAVGCPQPADINSWLQESITTSRLRGARDRLPSLTAAPQRQGAAAGGQGQAAPNPNPTPNLNPNPNPNPKTTQRGRATAMQRSRDIYDCHFLPQAHYVFGLDGKRTCDHVLRFSTLATDFRHLMRSHNLSNGLLSVKAAAALYNESLTSRAHAPLKGSNGSNGSRPRCRPLDSRHLTPKTHALIAKAYAEDFALIQRVGHGQGLGLG